MTLPRRQMRALLRRRAPAPSKSSESFRLAILASAVTFLITVIGFGFSALGFWATIKRDDDVRVLISDPPYFYLDDKKIIMIGTPKFTFIDSGNREAAITNIGAAAWYFWGEKPPTKNDCQRNAPRFAIEFDAKPFVLKAGEIRVVETTIRASQQSVKEIGNETYEFPNFGYADGKQFLLCLELGLVTPDSSVTDWKEPAYVIVFKQGRGELQPLFAKDKPIVLRKSVTSGFLNYVD
jgi:hypothetical protein